MVNWKTINTISIVGLCLVVILSMFMVITGHNEKFTGTQTEIIAILLFSISVFGVIISTINVKKSD